MSPCSYAQPSITSRKLARVRSFNVGSSSRTPSACIRHRQRMLICASASFLLTKYCKRWAIQFSNAFSQGFKKQVQTFVALILRSSGQSGSRLVFSLKSIGKPDSTMNLASCRSSVIQLRPLRTCLMLDAVRYSYMCSIMAAGCQALFMNWAKFLISSFISNVCQKSPMF